MQAIHPMQQPRHDQRSCRIKTSFSTFGLIVAGWLLPLTSQATGFGTPQGEPVIGEPLSVEIEVINPERSELECFEIKPVGEESENGFFPLRAHLDLKKTIDGKTYLVVRSGTIMEPVVEFRLRTRCGTEVERRYTLLAEPPRELQPATITLPVSPPAVATTTTPPVSTSATSLPATGLTLNQLARQRYPLQPKAREKFKRLVKSANPDLALSDDEALPVDPASLKYPDNLPQRRTGPYRPTRTKKKNVPVPPKPPSKTPETALKTAPKLLPPEPLPQADRLVIAPGAAEKPQAAPAQESTLAAKAESSFAAQQEMTARLEQAELAYKGLQERLQLMEERMRALEMEKQRLQREQEALSQSALVELILAVVVGGTLGALLMSLWLRRRASSGITL